MMRLAGFALMLAWGGAANAGFYDGNKLIEGCQKARTFVLGYVAGAYDAAEFGQNQLFNTYWEGLSAVASQAPALDKFSKSYSEGIAVLGSYCTPKGAILDQATDIFCQYLTSHPGERHESANVLLSRALDQAWPCPKPKK